MRSSLALPNTGGLWTGSAAFRAQIGLRCADATTAPESAVVVCIVLNRAVPFTTDRAPTGR